ncbi:hypothetical protein [Herbiconiux sp. UC225_62]|uniref:hypothetical protein n=1 Tax=Herbiconiux sp. UC225_62 TaxID=3350168 RepID=UPI0036D291AD
MRATDTLFADILTDSTTRRITADLFVGLDRVAEGIECSSIDLVWDGSQQVLCSGKVELVYQDDWGRSIAPEKLTDWLAPFGAWLDLKYEITMGDFSRSVRLGRLVVQKPRDVRRQRMVLAGRVFYPGEKITVDVADAFSITMRERFVTPGQPPTAATAWGELARLTGWPILRNVPDVDVPQTVTYQENRLDAVFDLGDVLGGSPYLRADNTLTIRPFTPGAVVATLHDGPEGQIVSHTVSEWDADQVYNQVVVRITDGDMVTAIADARITEGRLRYGLASQGAWGRIPYYVSSEYLKSVDQARAYAQSRLAIVSQQKTTIASIEMLPDPRLEVGDVVRLEASVDGSVTVGRIQKIALSTTGPMKVEAKLL